MNPALRAPSRELTREIEWLLRDKYGGRLTSAAARDISRLKRGEHINYLIGWAPFLDCRIDLSNRPLIPRPETEYWTGKILEGIKKSRIANPKILDLFCGSGCIGIAALKHAPKALVDFSDIDKKLFAGIRKSLRANGLSAKRARYVHSDVFKKISPKEYDYILANPPYVPTSGRAVARSVLTQEPRLALFAGRDGMRYIKKVLREAGRYLGLGGLLVFEFDPMQKEAIRRYATAGGWQPGFFKDQHGRWRYAELKRIDNKKTVK